MQAHSDYSVFCRSVSSRFSIRSDRSLRERVYSQKGGIILLAAARSPLLNRSLGNSLGSTDKTSESSLLAPGGMLIAPDSPPQRRHRIPPAGMEKNSGFEADAAAPQFAQKSKEGATPA